MENETESKGHILSMISINTSNTLLLHNSVDFSLIIVK